MKIYTNTIVFDDQVLGGQHLTYDEAVVEAVQIASEVLGFEHADWTKVMRAFRTKQGMNPKTLVNIADDIRDQILDLDTVAYCDIAEERTLY